MDKNKEIKLLTELCEGDTYFAQLFRQDLDQMVQNIRNDFAIELDTDFYKVAQPIKEKLMGLAGEILCEIDNNEDIKHLKPYVINAIGLHQVLSIKLKQGYNLDTDDRNYILNWWKEVEH